MYLYGPLHNLKGPKSALQQSKNVVHDKIKGRKGLSSKTVNKCIKLKVLTINYMNKTEQIKSDNIKNTRLL